MSVLKYKLVLKQFSLLHMFHFLYDYNGFMEKLDFGRYSVLSFDCLFIFFGGRVCSVKSGQKKRDKIPWIIWLKDHFPASLQSFFWLQYRGVTNQTVEKRFIIRSMFACFVQSALAG